MSKERIQRLFDEQGEAVFGCSLAIFAAVLAVADLGGGKYGDDELQLTNEKTAAYLWYHAKGIKESLAEGQRDLLSVLMQADAIRAEQRPQLTALESNLSANIARYKKEKKEILLGSKAVGQANWAQDIGGEMGKVVGAQEIEGSLATLSHAGESFDLATLCLQLSLVLGAIGIITRKLPLRVAFFVMLLVFGLIGSGLTVQAYGRAGAF